MAAPRCTSRPTGEPACGALAALGGTTSTQQCTPVRRLLTPLFAAHSLAHFPAPPRPHPLPRSVGRPVEKREGDGAADFSQLLHRDGSVFSVVYPKDLEQPE